MTTVELYYSGAWHDITTDVLERAAIEISHGRTSPTRRPGPARCRLSLRNPDGTYSPRLTSSPLYGLIGRNTPVRESEGGTVRFVGEIEAWPQRWDTSGKDVWAPVAAYGPLRRLGGAGTRAPVQSAQWRAHTVGALTTGLVEWWPLETGTLREQATFPAGVTGSGDLIAYQSDAAGHLFGAIGGVTPGPAGAASATDLSGGAQLYRYLTPQSSQDPIRVELSVKAEPYTLGTFGTLLWLRKNTGYAGTELFTIAASGTGGQTGVDFSGPGNGTNRVSLRIDDGAWHHLRLDLAPASGGANTTYELAVDGDVVVSGTQVGATYAYPYLLQLSPGTWCHAVAHVGVWAGASVPADGAGYAAFTGHDGETVAERLTRLASEAAVTLTITGAATDLMGPQKPVSVLDNLYAAADVDGGILADDRTQLGLTYRSRAGLYSQTPALTLAYPSKEVAPPLELVEDSDLVANDITVTRDGGGSSRAVQETGSLNVSEPSDDPTGVGRYPVAVTLSLAADDQTGPQAAWRRHVGTYDAPRYSAITVDLTALELQGKTALVADIEALTLGDRVLVTDPPAWTGGDDIDQLVYGYTETITAGHRRVTLQTAPAGAYDVAVLDSATFGVLDSMILAL